MFMPRVAIGGGATTLMAGAALAVVQSSGAKQPRGPFSYTQRCARAMMAHQTMGSSLAHVRSLRRGRFLLTV